MPLNSIPPTTTVAALEAKQDAAARPGLRRRRLLGRRRARATWPTSARCTRPGVFGFKCFLLPSGVEEFPQLDDAGLRAAMAETRPARRAADRARRGRHRDRGRAAARPAYYAASSARGRPKAEDGRDRPGDRRPPGATGGRAHIVHLSRRGRAAGDPRGPRRAGVPLTVETCPHYLLFAAEEIPDGATEFKCCPPIRDAANRELLWAGARDGDIDLVVSDHSPCTPELKRLDSGDFGDGLGRHRVAAARAARGVDRGAHAAGSASPTSSRWMCDGAGRPGRAAAQGPDRRRATTPTCACWPPTRRSPSTRPRLHHRNPVSAYAGRTLTGTVRQTWLRGVPGRPGRRPARAAAEEGRGMSYYVPTRRAARAGRADHRPGGLHRGVRRAAARHDARHRHQPAPALGRHPAVGDRPAAVGLRRDVQPVRRRGRHPAVAATGPRTTPAPRRCCSWSTGTDR